jgi:molybdenum cofactor cytidylyltransferase
MLRRQELKREAQPMTTITAVLLAAGMSRRFGPQNKLLADFHGEPLVRRTASAICESKAGHVIAVLGHQAEQIEVALEGLALKTVLNSSYRDGQVTSVRTGLSAVGEGALGVMMCLSDQPLLQATDYNALIDAFIDQPDRIAVPFVSRKRGNPVILPASLRVEILDGGINVGCRSFIDSHPELVNSVNVTNPAYRTDFDTPETFAALH